ncbi:ImmA/IrrE family metallo-endopeptidase [Streptomyces violaceusniger]|uniref:ImmA/IrrE family metallo-endopeptidase n=1 Tax=Streptomyces violaceusniger TaxID=68280 RepID=UPI0036A9CE54
MAVDDPELFSSWRRTGYEGGTGMRVGRIRRQCKQLIKELGLPASTDLPGLCDIVARRVGRPVHLVPMSLGGVVSGMTASTDEDYWIFYELRTSPWHQIHIVLHEIGHLLLGHEQDPAVTEEALRMWTPSVDVTTAMRRLGMTPDFARHHCYDNLTERETEVLGTLLMEHVVPTSPDHGLPLQGRAAELAAALGPALRHVRTDRAVNADRTDSADRTVNADRTDSADHARGADRTGGADGGVRGEPGGDTGV